MKSYLGPLISDMRVPAGLNPRRAVLRAWLGNFRLQDDQLN